MYYLKNNAIAEPLVYHWYASIYLISPVLAAMRFANSHLKIMGSYVSAPRMHELACQHPEMKGGPFIDYPTQRVEEVQNLIVKTREVMKNHLIFCEAIKDLYDLLNNHPKGISLESLYDKLPDAIAGYVELYYDIANRPHFRFIEALLYQGELNTGPLQNVLLSLVEQDYRPFCLSTPRLIGDEINIVKPFRDSYYDRLFSCRENPVSEKELNEIISTGLGNNSSEITQNLFRNLFTTDKPVNSYVKLAKDEDIRVRYFGHACVLIETHECSILFDPVLSYTYPSDIERYSYADLPPKIDYVVLTHAHQDHVLIEHLLQMRYKIRNIVAPLNVIGALQDPSLKLMLEDIGFESVISLHEFDKISLPHGYLQALPFLGEHADLYIQSKLMFLVNIAGVKILCAADSNNLDPKVYEKTYQLTGDVDVLFIGMECAGAPLSWLYQSFLLETVTHSVDQSRRLDGSDFNRAKGMVDLFSCKQVYIYAMGQEPWLNYVMGINYTPESLPIVESDKLIDYCSSKNIKSKRLFGSEVISL